MLGRSTIFFEESRKFKTKDREKINAMSLRVFPCGI